MNIEMNLGSNGPKIRKSQPSASNILILGDFSGNGRSRAASEADTGIRNMFTLDPNKLDAAITRIGPVVTLELASEAVNIPMTSMASFHPDTLLDLPGLFESVPPAEVQEAEEPAPVQAQATDDAGDNDFARLLGGTTAAEGAASPAVKSTLDKLIADAVASDATPESTPDRGPSGGKSPRLREVLQATAFQGLESAWRSLQWLGEHIEYDESASIWLVDADVAEIDSWSADFMRQVAAGPGSAAALVVLHDYSAGDESILQALARLAGGLNTIAFAGASNSLTGLNSDISKAVALDSSDFERQDENQPGSPAELSNVVLAFPNLLLRQPYGKRSDPIDAFDFDELGVAPAHDAFLWGNASIVLALMWLTNTLIVDDALLVTYDDGSGQAIKPPTGAYMTDSAANALLARGIVPLLAQRGGTDIRVPRLQSMAISAV
jgi:type VI secretion system protein ImpC